MSNFVNKPFTFPLPKEKEERRKKAILWKKEETLQITLESGSKDQYGWKFFKEGWFWVIVRNDAP